MPCRGVHKNSDQPCFCSSCHLSANLFPRREDGKIVLPAVGESTPHLPDLRYVPQTLQLQDSFMRSPSYDVAPPSILDEAPDPAPGSHSWTEHHPRGGSDAHNTRSLRVRSQTKDPSSSTSKSRRRSQSYSYIGDSQADPDASAAAGRSNSTTRSLPSPSSSQSCAPFPLSSNAAEAHHVGVQQHPQVQDEGHYKLMSSSSSTSIASTAASGSSTSSTAVMNAPPNTNPNAPNPPLKFCPPFVSSDRIMLSPDSDAAKEGITMIPWSIRRRKQKYRSGFDSTGQGKGKTMFRYYGPEYEPPSKDKKR